jgi:DNA-binding LytR/AlgR family response regulator
MMKVRYLVVDDEPLARKLVISHASRIDTLEFSGEFANALDANYFLRNHQVDLLFLDIEMPEMSGLQFISSLTNPPGVILITAYRNFAPEAFDLDVVDYLLKPVSFERLYKAVKKFLDRKRPASPETKENTEEPFIYIKADRKMHKVMLNDIVLIESLDEYIRIHMKGKILVSRENISAMELKLGSKDFVRIHRSYIISRRYITSISSDGVELAGKMLPFGRTFKMTAMSALGLIGKLPPL